MKAKIVKEKIDTSNIIGLGQIAKQAKRKDNEVIDATIGMLYDENNKLFTYNVVNKALKELTDEEKYSYSSSDGSPLFKDSVKRWVFGDNYDYFNEYTDVIASLGGTGALSLAFSNYLNHNENVILPNYMWTNYTQIAEEHERGYVEYNYLKDDKFDLDDFKEKALIEAKERKKVMLLLNDPAENPTGYSLTDDELDNLITTLNELSKISQVVLVIDLAYIDYYKEGYKKSRERILKYKNLNEDIITLFSFSASKSFGLYGLRVGGLICYSKDKNNIKSFNDTVKFSARSIWSNASNLGLNLISKIITDDKLKNSYLKELDDSRKMLLKRGKVFIDEANKYNIKTLPYDSGFFVSILSDDPEKLYEDLKKHKLHVIPFDNLIRIAISSINFEEVKKIPYILSKVL